MYGVDYPEPRGPHGYTQGGLAFGDTSNASASDGGKRGYGLRSQYRMKQPKQVVGGSTSIQTTPPNFGIPGVTDADRTSPVQAGFGQSAYPGPIQNAGFVGMPSQSPISDPSFGGGGSVPGLPGVSAPAISAGTLPASSPLGGGGGGGLPSYRYFPGLAGRRY
jgi:hypothetical protein